jgi:RNA polymerase sigma-70 factor, ECF subfamily
MRNDA